MHKTAGIRSDINQFHQLDKEPFWRYLERFKDLLTQCHHHDRRLSQIIFEGVDYQSKTLLQFMSHRDYIRMKHENF